MNTLVGYFPALHAGVTGLIDRRLNQIDTVRLISEELLPDLGVRHEPRAVPANLMVKILINLYPALGIGVLDKANAQLELVNKTHAARPSATNGLIVTADQAGRQFLAKYCTAPRCLITWDTTFLHWDGDSVQREGLPNFDREVAEAELGQIAALGRQVADQTSDYWRRVGVVLFREDNREVLLTAHNEHLPSEHTPYVVGDIRNFVPQGTDVCKCGAVHGEANIVAIAAREGIVTAGASVYQTYFPCVPCAKTLAVAGIRRVYFSKGNAYLDVEQVLRGCGVEMVYVRPLEP